MSDHQFLLRPGFGRRGAPGIERSLALVLGGVLDSPMLLIRWGKWGIESATTDGGRGSGVEIRSTMAVH